MPSRTPFLALALPLVLVACGGASKNNKAANPNSSSGQAQTINQAPANGQGSTTDLAHRMAGQWKRANNVPTSFGYANLEAADSITVSASGSIAVQGGHCTQCTISFRVINDNEVGFPQAQGSQDVVPFDVVAKPGQQLSFQNHDDPRAGYLNFVLAR